MHFVIYHSDSNIMMEFDPIQDIIAGSTTLCFFYVVVLLPATPTSSFVSPTPQFCDKELHPFFFSVYPLIHDTDLTGCCVSRSDRHCDID